jgi:hypothetical protein
MKKNQLATLIISLFIFSLNAQNAVFEVTDAGNGNTIVNNNSVFGYTVDATETTENHFQINNLTATTQSIQINKDNVKLNSTNNLGDTASAYFCAGTNCFGDTVTRIYTSVGPNASIDFRGYLEESSQAGYSEVKYTFISGAQTFSFTLKYNGIVSVFENSAVLGGVSNVYPNPAKGAAFISVNALYNQSPISIKLINALGSVVSSEDKVLNKGKNTIDLNTESLKSGIYFVSLKQGNSIVTKKVTVIN